MWFIDRTFLGTRKHLLIDGTSTEWTVDIPGNIPNYPSLNHDSLINFLAILDEVKIPKLLPENIEETLNIAGIPISQAGAGFLFRPKELQAHIKSFVLDVDTLLKTLNTYQETYFKNTKLLAKCQDALYSPAALKIADVGGKISLDNDNFAPCPVYNIGNGKTGRMTITSGSQILTCPREVKNCIRSRFKDGKIVEIDFSSLEPRTALAVTGSPLAETPDIYSYVGKLFTPCLSREKAKQVTISFLYGAAKNTIHNFVGGTKRIDAQLDELQSIFGFNTIVNRAENEVNATGFFRNHAGRPIYPQSSKRGLLFNNFCQSSAVDVALSGFESLLEYIEKNTDAVPLYFIHDALILDVPSKDFENIKEESKSLPTYLGINFPTKTKILHN
jgi:hypothetical protein